MTWYGVGELQIITLINAQGPVVRRPISAYPGVKFNPRFFFLCLKAFSRITFSVILRASDHQLVDQKNEDWTAF